MQSLLFATFLIDFYLNQVLYQTVENIRKIAILLLPFIPNSANKILDLLNVNKNERENFKNLNNPIKSGQQINQPQIIFPNIKHNIINGS